MFMPDASTTPYTILQIRQNLQDGLYGSVSWIGPSFESDVRRMWKICYMGLPKGGVLFEEVRTLEKTFETKFAVACQNAVTLANDRPQRTFESTRRLVPGLLVEPPVIGNFLDACQKIIVNTSSRIPEVKDVIDVLAGIGVLIDTLRSQPEAQYNLLQLSKLLKDAFAQLAASDQCLPEVADDLVSGFRSQYITSMVHSVSDRRLWNGEMVYFVDLRHAPAGVLRRGRVHGISHASDNSLVSIHGVDGKIYKLNMWTRAAALAVEHIQGGMMLYQRDWVFDTDIDYFRQRWSQYVGAEYKSRMKVEAALETWARAPVLGTDKLGNRFYFFGHPHFFSAGSSDCILSTHIFVELSERGFRVLTDKKQPKLPAGHAKTLESIVRYEMDHQMGNAMRNLVGSDATNGKNWFCIKGLESIHALMCCLDSEHRHEAHLKIAVSNIYPWLKEKVYHSHALAQSRPVASTTLHMSCVRKISLADAPLGCAVHCLPDYFDGYPFIAGFTTGSATHQSDLQLGDVILQVNGRTVRPGTPEDFASLLSAAGKLTDVTVHRPGLEVRRDLCKLYPKKISPPRLGIAAASTLADHICFMEQQVWQLVNTDMVHRAVSQSLWMQSVIAGETRAASWGWRTQRLGWHRRARRLFAEGRWRSADEWRRSYLTEVGKLLRAVANAYTTVLQPVSFGDNVDIAIEATLLAEATTVKCDLHPRFLQHFGEFMPDFTTWTTETYTIHDSQHCGLLVFWLWSELARRCINANLSQALLRARRLQFIKDEVEIREKLRRLKLDDSFVLGLLDHETDPVVQQGNAASAAAHEAEGAVGDVAAGGRSKRARRESAAKRRGKVAKPRALVRMQGNRRILYVSRGVEKVTSKKWKAEADAPNGEAVDLGTYDLACEAALAYDTYVRKHFGAAAETMVNFGPVNTQRLSLDANVSPQLQRNWPDDAADIVAVSRRAKRTGVFGTPWRDVAPLATQEEEFRRLGVKKLLR